MTEAERRRRTDSALAPATLIARYPGPAALVDERGALMAVSEKGARLAELLESGEAGDLTLGILACASEMTPRPARVDHARDGDRFHLEVMLMPVDHDGQTLVMVLARDVTVERKLTEALVASRRLFKDIEAVSSDFGWETDNDGRFTYVSVRGALGYDAHELHGDSARRLAPDDRRVPEPWPFEARQPIDSAEIWLRRRDGTLACCELSSRPVLDETGYQVAVRGVARDVTERKTAEEARARAEAEAIAANEAKSRFLAIMSHELRTPINSVIGNLELLKTTSLDVDQAEMIHATEIAAESLLRIIGDVLDFSKIEAGKIDLEELTYEPGRLVHEVVSLLNPSAIGKGIAIEGFVYPSTPERASLDPYRIRQILMNLIGNALKFTEIGGITVSMSGQNGPDGRTWLSVTIEDTGIGFDPEVVDLFAPFTQVDGSTTRRFGGSGLGLSICRGLVERMGGRIGVDARPGEGATFWFTVPVADPIRRADPFKPARGHRVVIATEAPEAWTPILESLGDQGIDPVLTTPGAVRETGLPMGPGAEVLALVTDDPDLGRSDLGVVRRILARADDGLRARRLSHRQGFSLVVGLPPDPRILLSALTALVREELPATGVTGLISGDEIAELGTIFAGRRVMVLEDNPMSRAVVARQFAALGVDLVLAENGRQGLEELERQDFAVILSDCAMPEIDGYLFTQILRRREMDTGRRTPVIAMTANAAEEDAKRCLAAGMDDYLAKPVRLSALARVLARWGGGGAGGAPGEAGADGPMAAAPIDLKLLGEIMGEETPQVLTEALDMFAEFFPAFLDEARRAAAGDDLEDMIDVAHSAKGAARNAGARALGAAMSEAEARAKAGDRAGYRQAVDVAGAEWANVEAFIAARRAGQGMGARS